MVAWGGGPVVTLPQGMNSVVAITGGFFMLYDRRPEPCSTFRTRRTTKLAGSNATFTALGEGCYAVAFMATGRHQPSQRHERHLTSQTKAANQGVYDVVVTNQLGSHVGQLQCHLHLLGAAADHLHQPASARFRLDRHEPDPERDRHGRRHQRIPDLISLAT